MGLCPDCGREHKRSATGPCPRCAKERYHQDPELGDKRKEIHRARVKEYQKENKDKRREWSEKWKLKVGERTPYDVRDLRYAVKQLEKALALAHQRQGYRQSNHAGDDDGAE